MEEITIKINDSSYKLKRSYRALMLLEKQIGKSVFNLDDNLNNTIMLFYYILQVNNKETFKFTYDEFIDVIDMNPESIEVFTDFLQSEQQAEANKDKKKVVKK